MKLNPEHFFPSAVKLITPLFFVLLCFYHALTPEGAGDEGLFISDLDYIKSYGWIAAIEKGIALTYLILAYPLSLIVKNYVALRITNMLLLLFLFFYFSKWGSIKNKQFYNYLLLISASGFFLAGTNDTLFIVSMVIFFNETYKFLEKEENSNGSLLLCSVIIAFFTRELIYIYIPLILLSSFLIWKIKGKVWNQWYIPVSLLITLLVVNMPCIEKNQHISYDNKNPDSSIKATWVQRQYLAQLLVNDNKIPNQTHPSWEETDAYLLKHGENSLPRTTAEGIFFDFKLTVLEFFKDFSSTVFLSIRQTGIMYISVIAYLFFAVFQRRINTNLFLPFVGLFVVAVFSFIIISFVEGRWLLVSYIVAILYYSNLEVNKKLPQKLILLNHAVLILVMFYGSFKVLLKLL